MRLSRFIRASLWLAAILTASGVLAASWIHSTDGVTTDSYPQPLPRIGVDLQRGVAIGGLRESDETTAARCGWYRIVPAICPIGETAINRSYTITNGIAREMLVTTNTALLNARFGL